MVPDRVPRPSHYRILLPDRRRPRTDQRPPGGRVLYTRPGRRFQGRWL